KKPGNDHADDDRERRHDQPVPQFAQMLEKGHRAIGWYRRRLEPLQTEMDRPALDRQRHGSLGKASGVAASVGARGILVGTWRLLKAGAVRGLRRDIGLRRLLVFGRSRHI